MGKNTDSNRYIHRYDKNLEYRTTDTERDINMDTEVIDIDLNGPLEKKIYTSQQIKRTGVKRMLRNAKKLLFVCSFKKLGFTLECCVCICFHFCTYKHKTECFKI